MEITKICTKCKEEKLLSCYSYHKHGIYQKRPTCKSCCSIANTLYSRTIERKEQLKIINKKNIIRLREIKSKSCKKNIDNLTDSYILKSLIAQVKINKNDIPQEIIDLKRILIKTHRLCQKLQN